MKEFKFKNNKESRKVVYDSKFKGLRDQHLKGEISYKEVYLKLRKQGFYSQRFISSMIRGGFIQFSKEKLKRLFKNDNNHWSIKMFEDYIDREEYIEIYYIIDYLKYYNVSPRFINLIKKKYYDRGIKLKPNTYPADFFSELSELLKKYTMIKGDEIVDIIHNKFDTGLTHGTINNYRKL